MELINENYDYKKEHVDGKGFFKVVSKVIEENKNISMFEAQKYALSHLGISMPSQYFGCNGWEGFIKIKEVGNAKNNIDAIEVNSNIYKEKSNPDAEWLVDKKEILIGKNIITGFYRGDKNKNSYFYGSFEIKFKLAHKSIQETVLFPLLLFIEKYGFIGGKNNLGYGRVKFVFDNKGSYCTFKLKGRSFRIDKPVEEKKTFDQLIEESAFQKKKIGLFKFKDVCNDSNCFMKIIKALLKEKSNKRKECKLCVIMFWLQWTRIML